MKLKKTCLCLGAWIVAISFNISAYAYHCDAEIRNYSNSSWTFTSGATQGDVYFESGVNCPYNGPCIIPPHTFVSIKYTTEEDDIQGFPTITDKNGVQKNLNYKADWPANACPVINFNSDPHSASVGIDGPTDGSYEILQDTW